MGENLLAHGSIPENTRARLQLKRYLARFQCALFTGADS
jgi:hypothetical protein